MATGKIKTLYSDKEKTEALFPKTKINAVSNAEGVGLDAILDNMVYYVPNEDAATGAEVLNADTLQGHPASDFATPAFVANKIAEAQLSGEGSDIDLSGLATKDELNALTAEDVGAAAASHNHSVSNITSGSLSLERGGTGRNFAEVPPYAIIRATSNTTDYPYLYYQATDNGAFYATSANGSPKFGTLPIKQGGTGATSPDDAISNLGGVPFKHTTINANSSIKITTAGNNLIMCRLSATVGTAGVYAITAYSESRAPSIAQLAAADSVTVATGGSNDTGWYTIVTNTNTQAKVYVTVYGGCTIT